MIRVSDIKQYLYCERVVFYAYCMPLERSATFKMNLGTEVHRVVEELERRRKLKKYNLASGERQFEVWMTSERLGLSGKLDMLIRTENEDIPVDFKLTSGRPQKNHLYQLVGYALLVEETFGRTVSKGFVYLIPLKDAVVFEIGDVLKDDVRRKIQEIEEMIRRETMPPPAFKNRCYDCEYLNFCNDIF